MFKWETIVSLSMLLFLWCNSNIFLAVSEWLSILPVRKANWSKMLLSFDCNDEEVFPFRWVNCCKASFELGWLLEPSVWKRFEFREHVSMELSPVPELNSSSSTFDFRFIFGQSKQIISPLKFLLKGFCSVSSLWISFPVAVLKIFALSLIGWMILTSVWFSDFSNSEDLLMWLLDVDGKTDVISFWVSSLIGWWKKWLPFQAENRWQLFLPRKSSGCSVRYCTLKLLLAGNDKFLIRCLSWCCRLVSVRVTVLPEKWEAAFCGTKQSIHKNSVGYSP